MKKKKWLIVITTILIVALIYSLIPLFFYSLTLGHRVKTGIKYYNQSTHHLCRYLTMGNEILEYQQQYSFYRYEYNGSWLSNKVTATMVLEYDLETFSNVLLDLQSSIAYSQDIFFSYKSFSFALNNLEVLSEKKPSTNYYLSSPNPYISWINLVGYSEELHQVAFLGFSYHQKKNIFDSNYTYYQFTNWLHFMEGQFSCFDWESRGE